MIKVSVILPVYNTGKYLRQCLESIENQTLKNFEVFCVDDGSTDDSVEIISEYEKKDSRFHLLEQKNAGGGAARNHGMEAAKGEYLAFLDSDDFFEAGPSRKAGETGWMRQRQISLSARCAAGTKIFSFLPMNTRPCGKSTFRKKRSSTIMTSRITFSTPSTTGPGTRCSAAPLWRRRS